MSYHFELLSSQPVVSAWQGHRVSVPADGAEAAKPVPCARTRQHRLGLQKSQIHNAPALWTQKSLKASHIQDLHRRQICPDLVQVPSLPYKQHSRKDVGPQEGRRTAGWANILQPTGTVTSSSEELSCMGYQANSKRCYSCYKGKKIVPGP